MYRDAYRYAYTQNLHMRKWRCRCRQTPPDHFQCTGSNVLVLPFPAFTQALMALTLPSILAPGDAVQHQKRLEQVHVWTLDKPASCMWIKSKEGDIRRSSDPPRLYLFSDIAHPSSAPHLSSLWTPEFDTSLAFTFTSTVSIYSLARQSTRPVRWICQKMLVTPAGGRRQRSHPCTRCTYLRHSSLLFLMLIRDFSPAGRLFSFFLNSILSLCLSFSAFIVLLYGNRDI